MSKDCGCNKKEKKEKKEKKKKEKEKEEKNTEPQKKIWVYKKSCNTLNIPDNSYLGKIGFTYHLVDNDKKENTEHKVNYKFSNLNPGEIVYHVNLYKVTKTKIDKKRNTISKYLECAGEYSYTSKLDQNIITNIINEIGNGNYNLTPHNSNEFNSKVIENILKTNGKKGTSSNSVRVTPVPKKYHEPQCGGDCANNQPCPDSCPICVLPNVLGAESYPICKTI